MMKLMRLNGMACLSWLERLASGLTSNCQQRVLRGAALESDAKYKCMVVFLFGVLE